MENRIEFEDYDQLVKWLRMFTLETGTTKLLPGVPYYYYEIKQELVRRENLPDNPEYGE